MLKSYARLHCTPATATLDFINAYANVGFHMAVTMGDMNQRAD